MVVTALVRKLINTAAWLLSFAALLKFPFLWFDTIWRTILFGMVTYLPVCKSRFQFWDLVKSGAAFEDVKFAARPGALLDIIHPPQLVEELRKGKNAAADGNNAASSASTKKFPLVMLFSGGAWIIGKKLWVRPMAMHFADCGFVAVAVDYVQWPFGTMPQMVTDALDAFVWVFDQCGKPGPLEHVDADQVYVLGQSAGAHICSIALLELAKLRREQVAMAGQGCVASDRAFLNNTVNKGVPVAFIGLSGMFDLATTQEELHKKGLHRRVLQSMCGNRPVVDFCARSKSLQIAEAARALLPQEGAAEMQQQHDGDSVGGAASHRRNSASGEICDHDQQTKQRRQQPAAAASPAGLRNPAAVHFLPRFNLFLHGDQDVSAPLQQAINTCAAYNDAASRHVDELVGDDVEWVRHDATLRTAKDPFYILTCKASKASPVAVTKKQHQHSRSNSNSAAGSSSSFDNKAPSFSPTSDDLYCDCFEGNRSMFMSYVDGTHTSLIVQDFFRRGVLAPVVVSVLALRKSLMEIEARHRAAAEETAALSSGMSRQSSASLVFTTTSTSNGAAHKRCDSHGHIATPTSPVVANATATAAVAAPVPPPRVAPSSYAMVDLFTKHYLDTDRASLRNEARPVIWDLPMTIANKISAF